MFSSSNDEQNFIWGRLGLLVAELFTALAMIFLVANTQGVHPPPIPTPTPLPITPTPTALVNCGLDPAYDTKVFTVANADAVRNSDQTAIKAFIAQKSFKDAFNDPKRVIGLLQAYGGGGDVRTGITLANGIIIGLKQFGGPFTNETLFQSLAVVGNSADQITFYVFYFKSGRACQT